MNCYQPGGILSYQIVVNAAGVYADRFHNMSASIKPHYAKARELTVVRQERRTHVSRTIFSLPTKKEKACW